MNQRREEWDSLVLSRDNFWMIWRCHSILCFHFYFSLETTIRYDEKIWWEDMMRIWWERYDENKKKVSFWKFKVLSQQLRGTLTTTFERHLIIEDFTDMDQNRCRACTNTFDLFYASLSLKQTYFLNLTWCWLNNLRHNLFIFWYFVYIEVHPVPLRSFHKKLVKFWWGSMLFFVKVYSQKNCIFLLPIKH